MKDKEVQRLVNHLTLHGGFIDDLGLFHGKMGIALFFYHYARYTNESLYEILAGNLIEEIYESIHENLPATMEKGLCGIAWGLCTLLENNFLDGDVDEVLSDIDNKIMERDPMRITDLSFRTGLEGIWSYVRVRISLAKETQSTPPFDSIYISRVKESIQKAGLTLKAPSPLEVITIAKIETDLLRIPLGLDNGCAGLALTQIIK